MSLSERHSDTLRDLIESELGAVETYHQVVESSVGEAASARNEFRQMEINHQHSVQALGRYLGLSDAPISPGQWRRFIVAMQDTFKVLDNPSMIAALKNGETRLASQYERALRDDSIDSEMRQLIESTLLPRARAHAQLINRFVAAQSGTESQESRGKEKKAV